MEILVTSMKPVSGKIEKGHTVRGPGFGMAVTYTLADGTTRPGSVTAERKKDVPGRYAKEEEAIAAQAMAFSENGFASTTYVMGRGGMIPEPKTKAVGYKAPKEIGTVEAIVMATNPG